MRDCIQDLALVPVFLLGQLLDDRYGYLLRREGSFIIKSPASLGVFNYELTNVNARDNHKSLIQLFVPL